MDKYLVIYYDGNQTKHVFAENEQDAPDSTNPLAWGLDTGDEIVAVIDVAESAVESIWIDEVVVHPARDIDPAAEHAEAGVVETTESSD